MLFGDGGIGHARRVQGRLDRTDFERTLLQPIADERRILVAEVVEQFRAVLGSRQIGRHLLGMAEAGLLVLERRAQRQDRRTLLIRVDSAGRERTAVAQSLDSELDGFADIAGAQEISVERMDQAVTGKCGSGCDDTLCEHLPAEDPTVGLVLTVSDEEVRFAGRRSELEPAQIEDLVQPSYVRLRFGGCFVGHGLLPRMTGPIVRTSHDPIACGIGLMKVA